MTTFPNSYPPAAARTAGFATGSLVRILHNPGHFRIQSPTAWADTGHTMPTHYNVTGPDGRLHLMVPVERLTGLSTSPSVAFSEGREVGAITGHPAPRVRHTHCWNCQTILDHHRNTVCPKCRGLLCGCGGCRCNWPFASPSNLPGNFLRRSISR